MMWLVWGLGKQETDKDAQLVQMFVVMGLPAQKPALPEATDHHEMFTFWRQCFRENYGVSSRKPAAFGFCFSNLLRGMTMGHLDVWLACGVVLSTAATDAVYVMFNSAVSAQRRVPAATWSSVWYLLSAFAVISYTKNWVYVCFAAVGSWIGAYVSMTWLRRAKGRRAPGAV
jgi:hypothetical protein